MRFIDQVRVPIAANTDHVERKYIDITYAEGSQRRKLDIYLPNEGEGPFPVVIDIHGGGWYFGNKSEHKLNPALNMLKRGYAVVSIAYTLSGQGQLPLQIYEVKAAIRYIRKNANKYMLNGNKIALWGESSGSHYAALTATSASMGKLEDCTIGGNEEVSSEVQAVIGWFTPTNLGDVTEQLYVCGQKMPREANEAPDSPPAIILGAVPKTVPQKVIEMDPNTYVNENCPPFFLFHGTNDCVVPIMNSMMLAKNHMEKIGEEKVRFKWVKDGRHTKDDFDNEENYCLIAEFLDKFLK